VPPAELFKTGEYAGKFSQYDEQVRGPQDASHATRFQDHVDVPRPAFLALCARSQGIPTHEADGAEVSKSRRKKLVAEHAAQVQLHQEYQAAVGSGELLP